jgi:predicted MFS family arabinose efflux permease
MFQSIGGGNKMLKGKKIIWFTIALILGIIGLSISFEALTLNPFGDIALSNVSNAVFSEDLSLAILSDSNRTVTTVDTDEKVIYTLEGGNRRPNSFFFASEMVFSDSKDLYVLNHQWDDSGSYIDQESIKIFNAKGEYLTTYFTYEDETESHLRPVLEGMKWLDGALRWFELRPSSIVAYIGEQSIEIPFEDAEALVQDLEWQDENRFYLITKRGRIFSYDVTSENLELVRDVSEDAQASYLSLATDENGTLYINDIGHFGIFNLNGEEIFNSEDFQDGPAMVYYNFDVRGGRMIAVNEEQVALRDLGGNYWELNEVKPSNATIFLRFLGWVSLLLTAAGAIYFIKALIAYVALKGLPKGMARTLAMVTAIILSTTLISYLAISYYNSILVSQASNSLKNIVQNSRYVIDGDALEQIHGASDFYGDAYLEVSDDLQKMINYNEDAWNENLYTALYTVVDDRYYGLMYNDNGITPYYPFNAYTDDPYFYYFYDAYHGDITEGTEEDADGEWLFSMGPVYNSSDEVIAIVEVGMNKYIFDEWHHNIMKTIITDIISLVIIAILLVSEVNFFAVWFSGRSEYLKKKHEELPVKMQTERMNVIRTLALLTYIMIFMCTAFVPIMSKAMYEPIGQLPMAIAISLPILSEVLFTAITIIVAGFVAERRGWRTLFYIGVSALLVSALATALTRQLVLFIVIRAVAGIGNGMIQMTMHGFVNTGRSVAVRNEVYANMMSGAVAGINLGVVLGANLSDKFGYHNVFFVVFGFGLLALLFQFSFMRRYEVMSAVTEGDGSSDAETHAEPMTARRFMTQKSILSFFALIMIPAFLCYMYLEYFFPLYAERNGLTTSVVGIVFSLYGLFIVYFGPSMSTLTEKMFGVKRATSLASILTGVSLLAFALTGSLMGAILAVFILAVSDSFGESVYTTYFLALKESQQIGKSIAAGYLEFSSQIGKMLGTLAFGIALGFGEKLGIGIIGLVTLGFGLLFLLFEKPHQKKSHGEV